jgi:chromosomal replication initiator protein
LPEDPDHQPDVILYLTCDFINRFINAVGSGDMNQFRYRYRHVDMLVIDDIHFLGGDKARTQEEFFHTFNTLYQGHKQIVLSADCPPSEIPELEDRLVSRFNWGLVARIDKPCYETRMAILQKKAQMRGVDLPDDVLCYVATKIDANTRGWGGGDQNSGAGVAAWRESRSGAGQGSLRRDGHAGTAASDVPADL